MTSLFKIFHQIGEWNGIFVECAQEIESFSTTQEEREHYEKNIWESR